MQSCARYVLAASEIKFIKVLFFNYLIGTGQLLFGILNPARPPIPPQGPRRLAGKRARGPQPSWRAAGRRRPV
jgi:hypothetical protein